MFFKTGNWNSSELKNITKSNRTKNVSFNVYITGVNMQISRFRDPKDKVDGKLWSALLLPTAAASFAKLRSPRCWLVFEDPLVSDSHARSDCLDLPTALFAAEDGIDGEEERMPSRGGRPWRHWSKPPHAVPRPLPCWPGAPLSNPTTFVGFVAFL